MTGTARFKSMGLAAGPFRDREFCVIGAEK